MDIKSVNWIIARKEFTWVKVHYNLSTWFKLLSWSWPSNFSMNYLLEPEGIRDKWHVTVESLFRQWIWLSPTYLRARNRVGVAQQRGSVWRHLGASRRRTSQSQRPAPTLFFSYHSTSTIVMVISPGIVAGVQIYCVVILELTPLLGDLHWKPLSLYSLLRRNASNLHLLF